MMIASQIEGTFLSKRGDRVTARPMHADDAPILVDIFEHMSSESRYRRFNQTLDHVGEKEIRREAEGIAGADQAKNQGLIAFVETAERQMIPVGGARFVETGPHEAEVAISIRDDFQNLGIGTWLMRRLALYAKELEYRTLTASIRNDNPAIWKVFSSLPFKVIRTPEGSFSEIMILLQSTDV